MRPARIRNSLLLGYAALWLACLPQPVPALPTDRNQPITIEADSATLDDKRGQSTYKGNVHLRQGTLNLHGNWMRVHMRDARIEKIVLVGKPATYVQQIDASGQKHHAEAERIVYDAGANRLILMENAHVWQPGEEEFRSKRIIYNLNDGTINAGGDSAGDRVHITLQPNKSGAMTGPETETHSGTDPGGQAAPDSDSTTEPAP
jgi:lipopolysaccharide export system protein LptA